MVSLLPGRCSSHLSADIDDINRAVMLKETLAKLKGERGIQLADDSDERRKRE